MAWRAQSLRFPSQHGTRPRQEQCKKHVGTYGLESRLGSVGSQVHERFVSTGSKKQVTRPAPARFDPHLEDSPAKRNDS